MSLGTLGSTLNDELNRLANGGTYRDMDDMVDEALAAKQWANRENINPYSTDTVGILNEIAGLGLDKRNWLDFNGVCNYIAGTTGLPAAAALRQVYPTTDLLTSQASYYVDATAPTNWGSLGYISLNGVNDYLSIPYYSGLTITGDLDIRFKISATDWTPAGELAIATQESGAGTRNWLLSLQTNGTLNYRFSTDGTNWVGNSSVAPTVVDGQPTWLRVVHDVNNGASGNDVLFYTSTDGTTWTQLGTTITNAGTVTRFNSTSPVVIGLYPTNGWWWNGNLYDVEILNGINGTKIVDINIATDYKPADSSTGFFASTGQLVSVIGNAAATRNLGAAGSLLPTTVGSSTAADSNDPKFLDFTSTNYVYLPGAASNSLSVPDATALDITGDIDVRAYVAADDWTPAARNILVSKSVSGQVSYEFNIETDGKLRFYWSADGTNLIVKTSTASVSFADGAPGWVRVTLDVDNGASGNDVIFYTSTNGTTWTQLGTTVTTAGTTSIFSSTSNVFIGMASNGLSNFLAGKVFRAQIFNGIDGTKVLDVDTSVITAGSATTFAAVTGQTVTINRSTSGRKTVAVTQPTWLFGTDDYMEVNNRYMASGTYLYLPGVNGNYASSPDSAALDITGDLDLRVKAAMDDWTPSSTNMLLSKYSSTAGGLRSYQLMLSTSGFLNLQWSTDGSTLTNNIASTAVVTFADGAIGWVRATLDVDNGASGNTVTFFTSTDGSTWTQLGAVVTTAGVTSIFSGGAQLEVGTRNVGTAEPSRGKFFRAQVLNGIGGTVAFDANFETSITSLLQTSFTESSANAATVTINRSGSTYRSAGITAAGYLYPGATNTFTASATDFLNFGASDSFTVLGVIRRPSFSGDYGAVISKSNGNDFPGYQIRKPVGTSATLASYLGGASSYVNSGNVTSTAGQLETIMMRVNRTAQTITTNLNGTDSTSISISSIGSVLNIIDTLKIGRTSVNSFYIDMEFYAGAVFRQTLTAAQIRQIVNYFANREVYL